MAGRGPAPKRQGLGHHKPARGGWKPAPGVGWQHGPIPVAPDGLKDESIETWQTWFKAWYAAHWKPEDVPALTVGVLLFDQVQRGEYVRATELRLWMDTWGVTPKGQQDRRWEPPSEPERTKAEITATRPAQYAHLKVVE